MAKKKVTTVTEEVEEAPIDPVQEQLQKQSDERASKFLGEEVKNGEVVEKPAEEVKPEVKEEPKPEEKPQEAPKEEPKIDIEQIKKEAAEAAKQEMMKALAGDKPEEVDDYQKYQKDFFSKNKRQPTWFEVAKFMEDKAVAKLEEKQAAKQKEYEEMTIKQQKELEKANEQTNKHVESVLTELYETKKLPRIQDKNNPDDYGVRTRNAFFNTVIEVNQKRIAENKPAKTLKEIFYEDFKPPAKQVAGFDAPTNMGRGGYTPDDTEEIDYVRDIKGKTIRQVIMNGIKRATR